MAEYHPHQSHSQVPFLNDINVDIESPQEYGYPQPEAESPDGLAPGGGKWLVPHFQSFSQIVNKLSRTYRYTFDEAQRFSRQYSMAMRNEPVVMDPLRALQIPLSMLTWHLEPQNAEDPYEGINAQGLESIVRRIPRFQQLRRCLSEALFYGRYGVQVTFAWDWSTGSKNLVVRDWCPVNGDKLVFRYSGEVGILVHSTWNNGRTVITDRGRAYFLTPEEREALIVHEHEPEDSDFYEGDTAGAIHGVGFRGRLFWLFWLRSQVLGYMLEYLQRCGAGGMTVYYYEHGNPKSMAEVKAAAQEQLTNNCILFPRYRDGKNGGPGIERFDPSNSGVILVRDLVMNYFDKLIQHLMLGQELSSGTAATGLGSGVAELHGTVLGQRIKYHATDLDETLTNQLVAVLNKYNCPGNPCPRFLSEVDKPNADEYMEGVEAFTSMGGLVDAEKTRQVLALPKPMPGRPVLGMVPPPPGEEGDGGDNLQKSRRVRRLSRRYIKALAQAAATRGFALGL